MKLCVLAMWTMLSSKESQTSSQKRHSPGVNVGVSVSDSESLAEEEAYDEHDEELGDAEGRRISAPAATAFLRSWAILGMLVVSCIAGGEGITVREIGHVGGMFLSCEK